MSRLRTDDVSFDKKMEALQGEHQALIFSTKVVLNVVTSDLFFQMFSTSPHRV